ncbi:MAG: hypothetical protein JW929_16545 [Anaerolineales bacterium]|nr:hypothetical protein [Anaerolineales bacterium]
MEKRAWMGHLIAAAALLWLSGCQTDAAPSPTPTNMMHPSEPPASALSPTDVSATAPANTLPPAAAPTFTATPALNLPGLYYIYQCVDYRPEGVPVTINFCVQSVKVNEDLTMQFNVYWRTYVETGGRLTKRSDVNNQNMFLTDNLDNKYHAIGWGGNVAQAAAISKTPVGGWFLFPAAKEGAGSFSFWDADNYAVVEGIVLSPDKRTVPPTGTPSQSPNPPTGTPTANPNLTYNGPGTYWLYRCKSFPVTGRLNGANSAAFCINTVVIGEDRAMTFHIAWKVLTSYDVIKTPEGLSANLLLTDDLGNKYPHIQAGGCSAEPFRFNIPGGDCGGWLKFPAAKPGATYFRYLDNDEAFFIDGIVLAKE